MGKNVPNGERNKFNSNLFTTIFQLLSQNGRQLSLVENLIGKQCPSIESTISHFTLFTISLSVSKIICTIFFQFNFAKPVADTERVACSSLDPPPLLGQNDFYFHMDI